MRTKTIKLTDDEKYSKACWFRAVVKDHNKEYSEKGEFLTEEEANVFITNYFEKHNSQEHTLRTMDAVIEKHCNQW